MSSGLTAIWRARPLRLGRSTHSELLLARSRQSQFSRRKYLRPSAAAHNLRPSGERKPKGSDHVNRLETPKRPELPDDWIDTWDEAERHPQSPPKQELYDEASFEVQMLEEDLLRSNFADSVLVPRLKVFGTARQKHRLIRKHDQAVARQVYHERSRINSENPAADWRKILAEMAKNTPEESLEFFEDVVKIHVAGEVLTRITKQFGDDTFGAIRKRTGVTLKVFRDESTVTLSGTREAINEATEDFKHIAGKITVTRQSRLLDSGDAANEEFGKASGFFIPPLSREEGARYKKKRLTKHVDTIPMPKEWTPETLREYVISLIDTYTDPSLHSELYPQSRGVVFEDHERAVTRRLIRLFHSLPAEGGFSTSVVKLALSHMSSKGDKYGQLIRDLFVFLDRRATPMDTDVFNILLMGPVKMGNLLKFSQTIDMMTWRGFAPNLDTWLMFLRMFESVEVKSHILQTMNAKNLLGKPGVIRSIAEEMAAYDAEHAAIQHKSLETFLQEQDDRYGSNWLTCTAGNKVLNVLGLHGRLEDAFRLLDLMGERYSRTPKSDKQERFITRPDSSTFITILNHAWIRNDVPLAVNLVRKMKTYKLAQQPTSPILDLLFKIAWKGRLRTTITVIWRYASLARLTTYTMRRLVAKLLKRELGGPRDREMTASVYHSLGGETLARELVGGHEVLEQIKALCKRTWGPNYPRNRLASIAAKMLPVAFEEHGPAVPLGTVLCQSVLLDQRCLRARKTNQLKDLLASAQVKSLPLWMRRDKKEDRWTDLGPLEYIEPGAIRHDDIWQEERESEGWEASPANIAWRPKQDARGSNETAQTSGGQQDGVEQTGDTRAFVSEVEGGDAADEDTLDLEKRIVMINPNVWNDEPQAVSTLGTDSRTPLQAENELAYLIALVEMAKGRKAFRFAFTDEDGRPDVPKEDAAAGDEGLDFADPLGVALDSGDDRLESLERRLKELEASF